MCPGSRVAGGDHIGVAGEHHVRGAATDAGVEVVDRIGARFGEGHAMSREARALQDAFEHAERAGLGRRHRWAAQEFTGKRNGIGGHHHPSVAPAGLGWFALAAAARRCPAAASLTLAMGARS